MNYFEIVWTCIPERFAPGRGRAPNGGRYLRSLAPAREMVARYLGRLGQFRGTVEAAGGPMIEERDSAGAHMRWHKP